MKFGQAASHLLAQHDVDTVFGIPGVHTIELFRGIDQSGVNLVVPRHEQGAGFMADGYARTSGKPGVCFLISGPGLLNAMTPIAQAWHDSVPLLMVSSTVATTELGRHRGALHDVPDQAATLAPYTSHSEVVTDPERFAALVGQAFHDWRHGRPRPVHLSIPVDVLGHEIGQMERVDPKAPTAPVADPAAVTRAVDHLLAASSPVLIVGGGGRAAHAGVRALAELLDAPVVTTGNARGAHPAGHPLDVGMGLPFPGTQAMIASADVVVAIGTEFSETDVIYTGTPLEINGELIRIDIDPNQSSHWPELRLCGDAQATIESLLEAAHRAGGVRPAGIGSERAATARADHATAAAESGHQEWLDVLSRQVPGDALMAMDSAQLAYSAHHFLPWSEPTGWMAPYGLGTLGPALPMAIGASVAAPDRAAVAIAGDGGVLFTLPELATAVDLGRQMTLVIWDNAGYGEIRRSYDNAGIARAGTEVSAHDLVAIAEGFGAAAMRVDSPVGFESALAKSLEHPTPSVIVIDAVDTAGPGY